MRIISLLPSATEMVAAIGLGDCLVGISHECDYPTSLRHLPRVTHSLIPAGASSSEIDQLVRENLAQEKALYGLDQTLLAELRPDLIITQTLCEVCAVAPSQVQAALAAVPSQPQVLNLEPTRLDEVFQAMALIGQAVDRELQAAEAIGALRQRVERVAQRSASLTTKPRTMLLEWIDPPFCAGHWNPELVELAGGQELFGKASEPRGVEWEQVVAADPEVMLIACCGYDRQRARADLPILQQQAGWEQLTCTRTGRVYLTDGSAYFNRPGPRLVDSLEILAHAVSPQLHSLPPDLPAADCV